MTRNENVPGIFARNVPGMTERLAKACVGIAGCGGLGSNAAVALARAGVGHLVLADCDSVEPSNLNRQHYFLDDVGSRKVDALSAHLKKINPSVRLTTACVELTPENVAHIFGDAELLVEAFDKAENKHWLIEAWSRLFPGRPLVCGNGLSGYGRTEDLKVVRAGSLWFCGDGTTDMSMGLCSARVAIVAAMQANVAIELLMESCSAGP
jgi:sulfur carrier protein ThiS adenylyltransferase